MLRTYALVLTALTAAPAAQAEWGVGAAVQDQSALSVQYTASRDDAYHVLAHAGNDTAFFQTDYQRFYWPRALSLPLLRGGVYAGLGLAGEAVRNVAPGEQWFLHLPLGTQCDVEPLHLSVFAEVAARVGALPGTGLNSTFGGGIRAYF